MEWESKLREEKGLWDGRRRDDKLKRKLKWGQLYKWERNVNKWEEDLYLREKSNSKWEDSFFGREADILKKELEVRENV